MELPIKVNGVVYRKADAGQIEVLLVKRSPQDGGFWQTVTGTLNDGEKLDECLKREILEEAGIESIVSIKPNLYKFHWNKKDGTPINEFVFAVEVAHDSKVVLSSEHTEFDWLTIEDAITRAEMQSNKIAIEKLTEFLNQ